MAAPPIISAAGLFTVTRAGQAIGQAKIFMSSEAAGMLRFDGADTPIAAVAATKRLTGTIGGQAFSLRMENRRTLRGAVGSDKLQFDRVVLRPRTAQEMAESDAGPPENIEAIFAAAPDYVAATGETGVFWHHFGNLFYRGRLDGSARLLCIASDPGPAECLPFARRSLIGDSGQKTQGFLAKLGLTRSYVLVNAFSVAMRPSAKSKGLNILKTNVAIRQSRHAFYDALLAGGHVQAIVAFGEVAEIALAEWQKANPSVAALPQLRLAHPAAVDREGSGNDAALRGWTDAITRLRTIITPDVDGDASLPNFGKYFTEADYEGIPRRDLPPFAPLYVGDDSWGRFGVPRHNNCARRPSPDDLESLILTPAPGLGRPLRYIYRNGHLWGATTLTGQAVAVNAYGLEP